MNKNLKEIINNIINTKENFKKIPLLIGISGIDASGKGYISNIIQAYKTIFFPAQEIHFTQDNPKSKANAL